MTTRLLRSVINLTAVHAGTPGEGEGGGQSRPQISDRHNLVGLLIIKELLHAVHRHGAVGTMGEVELGGQSSH